MAIETLESKPVTIEKTEGEKKFDFEDIKEQFQLSLDDFKERAEKSQKEFQGLLESYQKEIFEDDVFGVLEKRAASLLVEAYLAAWREKSRESSKEGRSLALDDARWQGDLAQFFWENLETDWLKEYAQYYWGALEHAGEYFKIDGEKFSGQIKSGILGEVCFSYLAQKMGFEPTLPTPEQDVYDKIDVLVSGPGITFICQVKSEKDFTDPRAENLRDDWVSHFDRKSQPTEREALVLAAQILERKNSSQKYIPIWVEMSSGNEWVGGVDPLTGKPEKWYIDDALKSARFGRILAVAATQGGKR